MSAILVPVWVHTSCGTCGKTYTVNARTAPVIGRKRYCRRCWDRAQGLRAQLGWPVYDCPPGTWPDLSSDDPMLRGDGAVVLRKGAKLL